MSQQQQELISNHILNPFDAILDSRSNSLTRQRTKSEKVPWGQSLDLKEKVSNLFPNQTKFFFFFLFLHKQKQTVSVSQSQTRVQNCDCLQRLTCVSEALSCANRRRRETRCFTKWRQWESWLSVRVRPVRSETESSTQTCRHKLIANLLRWTWANLITHTFGVNHNILSHPVCCFLKHMLPSDWSYALIWSQSVKFVTITDVTGL